MLPGHPEPRCQSVYSTGAPCCVRTRPRARVSRGLALALLVASALGFRSAPFGARDATPASIQALIVSDNQFHHLLGDPGWIRLKVIDELSGTAIRPVGLDLFADDLLGRTLADYVSVQGLEGNRSAVLHLGDSLDVACTSEWERFVRVMEIPGRLGEGWALAPGNHDGFFYGMAHEGRIWKDGCREPGDTRRQDRRMTKPRFVDNYLKALSSQKGAHKAPWHVDEGEHRFGTTLLVRSAWKKDSGRPWRSFVVTQVDLSRPDGPPVYGLMLDTAQYERMPRIGGPLLPGKNAGLNGDVLEDQIAVLTRWVQEQPDAHYISFSHFPLEDLTERAQRDLEPLLNQTLPLWISAHTHAGFVADHERVLELNVGSITDFPNEVRTLQLQQNQGDLAVYSALLQAQLFFGTSLFGPREAGRWIPRCEDDWLVEGGDYLPSLYRQAGSRGAKRMREATLDAMLRHYRDLVAAFRGKLKTPDCPRPEGAFTDRELIRSIDAWRQLRGDAKAQKVKELQRYLACRKLRAQTPETVEAFGVCRALHAARIDETGGDILPNDTWFGL